MNEANNRKVLISIKVSTLLLIVLGIIVVVILASIIFGNRSENENERITTAQNIDEAEFEEPTAQASTTQKIKPTTITSRSLDIPRSTEHHVIEEVEETIEEEPEIITTPIEEVTISKDMDLTVRTGLSKEDFITLISNVEQDKTNFFEENAGLIYDVCEKYQLNEVFFCGLIAAESGWNIAQNHRNTYNYISLMSGNGLIKFSSVEDGMEKAALSLHENYLTEGGRFYYGPTLAGMKTKFCPASSTWVNLVYKNMEYILK